MNSAALPSADLAWSSPATPRGSSLAGKAYWAMVRRLVLTAACIDVGYIALFMWLGSWPLTLVNVGSIALYLAAYALIRHRKNAWGLALIWLEVAAHTALGSLLIGWESGFHYYLLLFVPAIVVANAGRYAVPLVVALLAYYLGLWALCNHLGTLAPLAGKGQQIVNWIHICIAFALSAALAGHYRRTIVIAENKLLKMATLDGLTGLYNRSHFQSQARHALAVCERTQEPVALLLCDIDHFKHVNDTHGHAVGDQVLQAMAKIMTQNMRAGDLLARWGGEEFLALLAYYLGLWALCNHLGPLEPLAGKGQQIVNWIHICIAFALSAALAGHYRRTVVIAERKLLKMATLDGLTGLYNRSHFQSQAQHTLAACERAQEPVALLLCDIDHFKQVNDTHGHAVGDQVLQATAKIMTQNMRAGDLLARWGG